MRLQDGQVMDFVKGTGPYIDERMGQVLVSAAPVAEAPSPPTLTQTVGTVAEPADGLGPVGQAIANVVESHAQAVSQWNNIPQQGGFQPPQVNNLPYHPQPSWFPTLPVSMPNDMNALRARIQARIDALESLDDKTPEMNATIKALKWVVEDIAKNTVSFTNGAAP